MKYMKLNLILMLGLVLQTISLVVLYFSGTELWSLVLFIIGALLCVITIASFKSGNSEHTYVLLSVIFGILLMGIFVFVFVSNGLLLLNTLNYAVCFLVLSLNSSNKTNIKIPRSLPDTAITGGFEDEKRVNEKKSGHFQVSEQLKGLEVVDLDENDFFEVNVDKNEKKEKKEKKERSSLFTENISEVSKKEVVSIKNKEIFHVSGCYVIKDAKREETELFKTRTQALALGLKPCKICKP